MGMLTWVIVDYCYILFSDSEFIKHAFVISIFFMWNNAFWPWLSEIYGADRNICLDITWHSQKFSKEIFLKFF